MALMKCGECGELSNDEAGRCVSCGASLVKKKPSRKRYAENPSRPATPSQPRTKAGSASARNSRAAIKNIPLLAGSLIAATILCIALYHVSSWAFFKWAERASGVNIEDVLISSLKDPDSYVREKMKVFSRSDDNLVVLEYRAKNGFGGYGRGEIIGKCDKYARRCRMYTQDIVQDIAVENAKKLVEALVESKDVDFHEAIGTLVQYQVRALMVYTVQGSTSYATAKCSIIGDECELVEI